MLRDSDHSRIHYKRVAEGDGKEVEWNHIVKGYAYEKDRYVVINDEDFKRIAIKSNQTVDIREFVNLSDVDPRFFDEPYFLAPEKGGAKAYILLREALERSGKAGVSKVVIRPPREHLAVVRPLDGVLMLELMHFSDELRDPSELKIAAQAVGQKELDMALSLINNMSGRWEPQKYRDEYRDALMDMIQQKIKSKGKKLPAPKEQRAPASSKVIDLVSILQKSLSQVEGSGHKKTSPKRKSAARKKAA
ncbi:MAG: Ku protein [Verrucomicrobiales bacterium]|nr:Ku protein [Verrucomicrobiales bacterium]